MLKNLHYFKFIFLIILSTSIYSDESNPESSSLLSVCKDIELDILAVHNWIKKADEESRKEPKSTSKEDYMFMVEIQLVNTQIFSDLRCDLLK